MSTIANLLNVTPATPAATATPETQSASTQPADAKPLEQNTGQEPTQLNAQVPNRPKMDNSSPSGPVDNNAIQNLINSVTSGNSQQNAIPVEPPAAVNDSTPNESDSHAPTDSSRAENYTQQFMRVNDINFNLLEGVNRDEVSSQIREGDSAALFDTINTAATNSVQSAVTTMLQMLPEIAESIVTRAVQEARSVTQIDSTWGSFVQEYPEYAAHERGVRPALEQMLRTPNVDKVNAFAAAAQMFVGLIPTGESDSSTGSRRQQNQNNDNSSEFNLSDFLQN